MGLLKKIGTILLRGVQIVSGVGPIVFPGNSSAVAKVADTLDQLYGIIVQAELFGASLGLTGAQKLQAATASAVQVFLQSAVLAGRKIADEAKFKGGVQKVIDGLVDILNSAKADGIETEDKV